MPLVMWYRTGKNRTVRIMVLTNKRRTERFRVYSNIQSDGKGVSFGIFVVIVVVIVDLVPSAWRYAIPPPPPPSYYRLQIGSL